MRTIGDHFCGYLLRNWVVLIGTGSDTLLAMENVSVYNGKAAVTDRQKERNAR